MQYLSLRNTGVSPSQAEACKRPATTTSAAETFTVVGETAATLASAAEPFNILAGTPAAVVSAAETFNLSGSRGVATTDTAGTWYIPAGDEMSHHFVIDWGDIYHSTQNQTPVNLHIYIGPGGGNVNASQVYDAILNPIPDWGGVPLPPEYVTIVGGNQLRIENPFAGVNGYLEIIGPLGISGSNPLSLIINDGTYNTGEDLKLGISVDGDTVQEATLPSTDASFSDLAAATASEVAAVLNAAWTGVTVTHALGQFTISHDDIGTTHSIQLSNALLDPLTALGLSGDIAYGTDDSVMGVVVNGTPFNVTFDGARITSGAVTAQQVADIITTDCVGASITAAVVDSKVVITHDDTGSSSTLSASDVVGTPVTATGFTDSVPGIDGDQISISVNGNTTQIVKFMASGFDNVNTATASEIKAFLDSWLGITVSVNNGSIKITHNESGLDKYFTLANVVGNPLGELSLTNVQVSGFDNSIDWLEVTDRIKASFPLTDNLTVYVQGGETFTTNARITDGDAVGNGYQIHITTDPGELSTPAKISGAINIGGGTGLNYSAKISKMFLYNPSESYGTDSVTSGATFYIEDCLIAYPLSAELIRGGGTSYIKNCTIAYSGTLAVISIADNAFLYNNLIVAFTTESSDFNVYTINADNNNCVFFNYNLSQVVTLSNPENWPNVTLNVNPNTVDALLQAFNEDASVVITRDAHLTISSTSCINKADADKATVTDINGKPRI